MLKLLLRYAPSYLLMDRETDDLTDEDKQINGVCGLWGAGQRCRCAGLPALRVRKGKQDGA